MGLDRPLLSSSRLTTWTVVGTTAISALVTAAMFVVEETRRLERLRKWLTPRSENRIETYLSNLLESG